MSDTADLGSQFEDYVTSLVTSGRYGSRSDVLREGIRLVEEREKHRDVLDAAIARGLADAEAGRVAPFDEVADRLRTKYQGMTPTDQG